MLATTFIPLKLNPYQLIIPLSSAKWNIQGLGLPGWGSGVTVPTSTNTNPNCNKEAIALPSLSNPAANPIEDGNNKKLRNSLIDKFTLFSNFDYGTKFFARRVRANS